MKIRRINLWGGPGSGKTTTATWLFSQLKILGYDIQFVEEYVKRWAYQKRPIVSFDQLFLTVNQISAEDEYLRNGVGLTITDCPIELSYAYSKRNKLPYAHEIIRLGRYVEEVYPSINIMLERELAYKEEGRYESEAGAIEIDNIIHDLFKAEKMNVIYYKPSQSDQLLKDLDKTIKESWRN